MTIAQISAPRSAADVAGLVERTQDHYHHSCGWPVRVDGLTVTIRTGEGLDALVMRASLGAAVTHRLTMLLMSTPALVYRSAPRSWVFLTGPKTPVRASTLADLIAAGVTAARPGTALVLPLLGTANGAVRWLDEPVPGRSAAPWQIVVSTVRALSSQRSYAA